MGCHSLAVCSVLVASCMAVLADDLTGHAVRKWLIKSRKVEMHGRYCLVKRCSYQNCTSNVIAAIGGHFISSTKRVCITRAVSKLTTIRPSSSSSGVAATSNFLDKAVNRQSNITTSHSKTPSRPVTLGA